MLPQLSSLRQPGGSRGLLPALMQEFRGIPGIGRRAALGVELGNVMFSSESKIKPCRPLIQHNARVSGGFRLARNLKEIFSA